jgi:uncharacterized protein with PIN domain
MTIRVVKTEPDSSVIKRKVCKNCGATLEFVPNDVKTHVYTEIDGGSDSYDYIDCPNCNRVVIVKN